MVNVGKYTIHGSNVYGYTGYTCQNMGIPEFSHINHITPFPIDAWSCIKLFEAPGLTAWIKCSNMLCFYNSTQPYPQLFPNDLIPKYHVFVSMSKVYLKWAMHNKPWYPIGSMGLVHLPTFTIKQISNVGKYTFPIRCGMGYKTIKSFIKSRTTKTGIEKSSIKLGAYPSSHTWRIFPWLGSVVNNHGDRKSPRPGVMGPLPNGV